MTLHYSLRVDSQKDLGSLGWSFLPSLQWWLEIKIYCYGREVGRQRGREVGRQRDSNIGRRRGTEAQRQRGRDERRKKGREAKSQGGRGERR